MAVRAAGSRLLAGAAVLAVMLGSGAQAETLREALIAAYQSNPSLTGARAGQRAVDEGVPLAKSEGRPALFGQGSYTENVVPSSNSFLSPDRQLAGGVELSVPIYSGGAVRSAVRAAIDRVEAGRANLRATESAVFSAVVAAYMDVIRNEAVVDLNTANVNVLSVNLQATSDRFEIGDLTRTDVAQSEARLSLARADLASARANLIRARERYIELVGHAPGTLEAPPPLPGLPDSPDTAVTAALDSNPDLIAAREAAQAAKADIGSARATRLPQLDGFAQGSTVNFLDSLGSTVPGVSADQTADAAAVGVRATIPIFQGGRPGALVRRSQAQLAQAQEREIEVERNVIAQTRAAWSSWQAALQLIESSERAVSANRLSLEGVRAENTVGNRTILDILDAEQELLNTQVRLVSARRDAYVAGFTLLAAMGKAEARDLALDGGALYDPVVNYQRVKGQWLDWSDDIEPVPVATRTIDSSAQNADSSAK